MWYASTDCDCRLKAHWPAMGSIIDKRHIAFSQMSLQWCRNERDDISNHHTSFTIVHSTVYSGTDQRKHQNSAPLAFVWGIHRSPVNSPHKGPVTRKIFPFDDVIMYFTEKKVWSTTRPISTHCGSFRWDVGRMVIYNKLPCFGRIRVKSLAYWIFEYNFRQGILKLILVIAGWDIFMRLL